MEKGKKQREEIERKIKKKVEEVISQINIATKKDIERLEKKIDELKRKTPRKLS
ncbi:phasin family protein [Candidatus Aerophobetes bacterium]|nr:phasin family protein [Candidatus Aerophobetes bacterium]